MFPLWPPTIVYRIQQIPGDFNPQQSWSDRDKWRIIKWDIKNKDVNIHLANVAREEVIDHELMLILIKTYSQKLKGVTLWFSNCDLWQKLKIDKVSEIINYHIDDVYPSCLIVELFDEQIQVFMMSIL